MAAGITLVDTSENYGLESRSASLSAEQILGQCMDTSASAPLLATTMSNPWKSLIQGTGVRIGAAGILKALENSADRLGVGEIDLYQVPAKMFYLGTPKVVANALVGAMDQGIIQHVGGVNMSKSKMARFHKNLSSGGYGLTSNAFEFSLVNRNAWKSGLISSCKSLGVIPIAQNPLGNGLASGEYTATNPTGGKVSGKSSFEFKELEKYTTLHDMLETVQKKVQGRLEGENRKLKDRRDRYGGDAVSGSYFLLHHEQNDFLCSLHKTRQTLSFRSILT
jgi:aryl-alcohol dehydrogenase-like predicted oxidoreductase